MDSSTSDSPATTRLVALLTLPAVLPPRRRTISSASARVISVRVPVKTTVLPANGELAQATRGASGGGATPACRSFSRTTFVSSCRKKRATLSAISGPTPGTAASADSSALSISSREPNCSASSRATVSPACRIPSPKINRESGRPFEAWIASSRFWALFSASRSRVSNCSFVRK